jgi:hypothetical protein
MAEQQITLTRLTITDVIYIFMASRGRILTMQQKLRYILKSWGKIKIYFNCIFSKLIEYIFIIEKMEKRMESQLSTNLNWRPPKREFKYCLFVMGMLDYFSNEEEYFTSKFDSTNVGLFEFLVLCISLLIILYIASEI